MSYEIGGMDPDRFVFMAEAEGQEDLVDTREAKVNAIANEIRELKQNNPNIDVLDHIDEMIEKRDIDIDSLTPRERAIIDKEF